MTRIIYPAARKYIDFIKLSGNKLQPTIYIYRRR